MTVTILILAWIGFLVVLAVVIQAIIAPIVTSVCSAWRLHTAKRKPWVIRRWRYAIGYRLLRPHIDGWHIVLEDRIDETEKQGAADDYARGVAYGKFWGLKLVRDWRTPPGGG